VKGAVVPRVFRSRPQVHLYAIGARIRQTLASNAGPNPLLNVIPTLTHCLIQSLPLMLGKT
jgi:hypothetical protein